MHPFKISPNPLRAVHSVLMASAMLLCSIVLLHAQANTEFAITKIEPQIVTTPAISYSGATQKASRPKNWMEVEVTFTWVPRTPTEKFSVDVTINYYVLLSNKGVAFPQGALLTGQVTHTSLPAKQSDLKTVMYLSPRSMERFFDGKIPASAASAIVDIGVTITHQGQVVAEKSLKGTGQWWPQYQQTAGYLLNKTETPFAPLNSDYYEAVKKQ
ncbi:MAG: hypothetical protein K8R38_00100 [Verrucomicrobia bacterium]|nr:hypothetical protein [Verrucomicrobiota bacterium]